MNDILDLYQEFLIICRRRSAINLLIGRIGLLRNMGFGILIEIPIILVNLLPCAKVIQAKLLDSLRVSDLVLFLWEHLTHSLALKGFDVLTQELLT